MTEPAELDREETERRIKELVEESLVAARERAQLEAEIIEAMLGGTI